MADPQHLKRSSEELKRRMPVAARYRRNARSRACRAPPIMPCVERTSASQSRTRLRTMR